MQVRDWFFTDSFVNFYGTACLKLGRTIHFLGIPVQGCPRCPQGCPHGDPNQDVAVLLDPRWSSRQAQQYATRAIFHHLLTREGFPAVRLRREFTGQEAARKLCHRLNWRVLGLVVNQKMDALFPAGQQDILLTELFVNTVKYINVCHEHAHNSLELSLPLLDIFYQYFSLRPRQQRQLAGTIKHKWGQVYQMLLQMVRLSENFSLMEPAECKDLLKEIIALLGVGEMVEVVYKPGVKPADGYESDRVRFGQVCSPVP